MHTFKRIEELANPFLGIIFIFRWMRKVTKDLPAFYMSVVRLEVGSGACCCHFQREPSSSTPLKAVVLDNQCTPELFHA